MKRLLTFVLAEVVLASIAASVGVAAVWAKAVQYSGATPAGPHDTGTALAVVISIAAVAAALAVVLIVLIAGRSRRSPASAGETNVQPKEPVQAEQTHHQPKAA